MPFPNYPARAVCAAVILGSFHPLAAQATPPSSQSTSQQPIIELSPFTVNTSQDVPGGRGQAHRRYDLVAPREIRFTTNYSF
jgi:hypothetical protein